MRVTIASLIVIGFAATCSAETLIVRVIDRQSAAAIPRAIVVLTNGLPIVRTLLTDDNGEVRIETSAGERLSLSVRSSGHGTKCVSAGDAGADAVIPIDLEPSIRVRGRIHDTNGRAIRQATVTTFYQEDPNCKFHLAPQASSVTKDGEYVIDDVDVSRTFAIAVDAPGFQRAVIHRDDVLAAKSISSIDKSGGVRERKHVDVSLQTQPTR